MYLLIFSYSVSKQLGLEAHLKCSLKKEKDLRIMISFPEYIGLSRYNRTTRPENYPCTKDEWAVNIPGDEKDADISLIRQLLAKTNLYDASKDGWKAEAFHSKVDKKGPCVILARSTRNGVFGGYNPTGWVNYEEASPHSCSPSQPWIAMQPTSRRVRVRMLLGQSNSPRSPEPVLRRLTMGPDRNSAWKVLHTYILRPYMQLFMDLYVCMYTSILTSIHKYVLTSSYVYHAILHTTYLSSYIHVLFNLF